MSTPTNRAIACADNIIQALLQQQSAWGTSRQIIADLIDQHYPPQGETTPAGATKWIGLPNQHGVHGYCYAYGRYMIVYDHKTDKWNISPPADINAFVRVHASSCMDHAKDAVEKAVAYEAACEAHAKGGA